MPSVPRSFNQLPMDFALSRQRSIIHVGFSVLVHIRASRAREDMSRNSANAAEQRESRYLVEDADLQLTGTIRFSIQASRSHCLYRTHFGPRRMNGISFLSQRHCARVSGERRIISATSSVV